MKLPTRVSKFGRGSIVHNTGWMLAGRGARLLGVDRPIAFTVLARGTQLAGSTITVLLIAHFLTPIEQGYYYTLWSMVALQIIFELGFSFVILQLAAHERAHLMIPPLGLVSGDPVAHSRLASILQKSVRWYGFAAVIMTVTLLPGGYYFFEMHQPPHAEALWRLPWVATVLATTLTFQIDPVFSFIEGCGQVTEVARARFGQAIAGTLMAWTAMVLHHGLFAPALVMVGQAFVGFVVLWRRRVLLLGLLRRKTGGHRVGWKTEVWPFQWRIAVSWLCSYLTLSAFTPILFATRGPVEAGKMGMSLNISSSTGALALAWMTTKASPFGNLVALRNVQKLNQMFFRTLWQSISLLGAGAALIMVGLLALPFVSPNLAHRVLPPPLFGLLLLTCLGNHVIQSEALYLRAHKCEPFLIQSIVIAVLVCTGAIILAKEWGTVGVVFNYWLIVGIGGVISATTIFNMKRRQWNT